jgi:multiple sugar transport system substrate-binding protein
MSTNFDRRQFLLGSTALVAAGAVAPAFAQDPGRLRLYWWGGQARADRTNKVSDLFKSKVDPKVTIDGEYNGSFQDYWTKLDTQVAGNNTPDVLQMDYRYIYQYATKGTILALDDYIGKGLDLSDFDKDQIDGGRVGGKLYAISLGANSVAMMVNTAAFKEAGVDLPTPDWSYDDYKTASVAWNKANPRNGMRILQDGSGNEPAYENWLRQRGKALYTADGKLAWTADDLVEWFKLWDDLRANNVCVSPDNQALDANAAIETTMITLGKAATTFANSNQLIAFQKINKDPLTMVIFPRAKKCAGGGHYRKPSQFWSIASTTPAKDESVKYVSFFINDGDAGAALGVERGIPCAKHIRDAIAPTLSDQDRLALNFVSNLGDLLGPLPPVPPAAAGEIDNELQTKSQEVAFGQSSAEDAGPAFFKAATDMLARSS